MMVLSAYPCSGRFFGKLLDRHFCFYNWVLSTFFFFLLKEFDRQDTHRMLWSSHRPHILRFLFFLTFICLKICIFSSNSHSEKWIKIIDWIVFKLYSLKIWGWHICLNRNIFQNVRCYFLTNDIPVYRHFIFCTILLLRNIKLVFCFRLNELLMITGTNFRIKNDDFLETIVIYHANRY